MYSISLATPELVNKTEFQRLLRQPGNRISENAPSRALYKQNKEGAQPNLLIDTMRAGSKHFRRQIAYHFLVSGSAIERRELLSLNG
ncbi:hypothetical protein BJV78DRAFT_1192834 [Lactifluus subvellereus]|nr:hypothetical protein BJV78DRAFT_1192834 [Lactifluus subvellereus]